MSMQGLRVASEQLWAKILMGVLIFSFVGWGAANWILGQTSSSSSLLKIGSVSVSVSDFEAERNRQIAQMEKASQKRLYSDKQVQKYFNQQIVTNLISRILLEQRAEDLGLTVSPAGVADIIKQSPEFWENNAFSTEKFDAVLDMNNISEKDFTETLRKQALREMIIKASMVNEIPVPNFVQKAVYSARNATRKIEYSTLNYSDFYVQGSPKESELREIYAQNPKVVPEYRTISYVLIGAEMDNTDSYDRGYDSTRSIEDMLVAGDSMKDAAKKMRATYRTFSPMTIQKVTASGSIKDSIFTDEIMKNLFSMEQGVESEIMEVKNGFVIFRVENVMPAHAVPLTDRHNEIVNLWNKSIEKQHAYIKANEILTNKEKLAKSVIITRTEGAPIEVLNTAFAQSIGKTSIVEGNDQFYVVKTINDVIPNQDAKKIKDLSVELKYLIPQQILEDYSWFLNHKYTVKTNERVMQKLFN